jgi:phosphomannomutase
MTLIKSISGIRGTIGGKAGDGLTPNDVVRYTAAYVFWLLNSIRKERVKVIIGRDARISGSMVNHLVAGTLQGIGADVIDIGLSTTPTVEMAVVDLKADGGIIITASHNPKQWNALKLLNGKGEFLSAADGAEILAIAENNGYVFSEVDKIGSYCMDDSQVDKHIEKVVGLKLVDIDAIKMAGFRIAIDCVNSTGGLVLPKLLRRLGVSFIEELYCNPDGVFPHNPEPLPEHLGDISKLVVKTKAHCGFVVDPDVDRLAIISENGEMFGEEYTLVAISDYVLSNNPGNTVSNLSSTRALKDITEKYKGKYYAAAVGEVNVVELMKKENAVIGGEGNGGVIFPELHYGRDALVGIALFLTLLAKSKKSCSALRKTFPNYYISKNKIHLTPDINIDKVLIGMAEKYKDFQINIIDGVRIDFNNEWVHMRKSNTEPIIRIYSESETMKKADLLALKIMDEIKQFV